MVTWILDDNQLIKSNQTSSFDLNCENFANTWEAEAGATLEVVEVQTHFVAALLPPTSPPASSQSPADSMLVDEDCL